MARVFTWHFQVRSYEVDSSMQVSPSTFLNYMEEAAVQGSADGGYSYDWYRENHRGWVVRKMALRFYDTVRYGDSLALSTWISSLKRVQCNREYDLRRHTSEPVLRARANWAFINTDTMELARIPAEIIEGYQASGDQDDFTAVVVDPVVIADPVVHNEERRVQHYELDTNGHVNNAVYLAWAEQAMTNALREVGWPPERFAVSDFLMQPIYTEIDYARSAMDDEPMWIVTRLAEIGRDRAAWQIEIRHGETGEPIAKILAVRAFTDAQGPRSIPDDLELALVRNRQSS